jgi:hypothetical protein
VAVLPLVLLVVGLIFVVPLLNVGNILLGRLRLEHFLDVNCLRVEINLALEDLEIKLAL